MKKITITFEVPDNVETPTSMLNAERVYTCCGGDNFKADAKTILTPWAKLQAALKEVDRELRTLLCKGVSLFEEIRTVVALLDVVMVLAPPANAEVKYNVWLVLTQACDILAAVVTCRIESSTDQLQTLTAMLKKARDNYDAG